MPKGIFCIEGFWDDNIKRKNSVFPVLELLERNENVKYFYHRCRTKVEFKYFVKEWSKKAMQKTYPILYLAFHGDKNGIQLSRGGERVSIDEIAEILQGKCARTIIFFASCKTLNNHKTVFNKFLDKTQALAVMGYQEEVNWYKSFAFEMLLLIELTFDGLLFDSRGLREFNENRKSDFAKLDNELKFRVIENKAWFPRKRKVVKKIT